MTVLSSPTPSSSPGHGACSITLNDASGSLNCFPAHSIGCPHLCGRNTTRSNMAGYRYAEFAYRVVQQNISSCCRADHLALAWIHGSTNQFRGSPFST